MTPTPNEEIDALVKRMTNWEINASTLKSRLASRSRTETFLPGSIAPELMRRSEELFDEFAPIGPDIFAALTHLRAELERVTGERDEWKSLSERHRVGRETYEEVLARAESAERARDAAIKERDEARDGEVRVVVSGFTGSGKSAVAGEIEIALRAIGVPVEWPDGEPEKRMTHADWQTALELYRPRVVIVERNITRKAQ